MTGHVRKGVAEIRTCLLGLVTVVAVSASAAAQSRPAIGSQQPPVMDRQKEITLALSACPPSLASKAAVYVLDTSGYVKVRDSQNGFIRQEGLAGEEAAAGAGPAAVLAEHIHPLAVHKVLEELNEALGFEALGRLGPARTPKQAWTRGQEMSTPPL